MNRLQSFLVFCRDSQSLRPVVWFVIALGTVPAMITENIIPFDIFALQFGIEVKQVDAIYWTVSFAIFLLAAALCLARRQYLLVGLLLPWLALAMFDIERLTYHLPTYSDVQERLRDNYDRVRESEELPSVESVREDLGRIRFVKNGLMPVDRAAIEQSLDEIAAVLGKSDTDFGKAIKELNREIARKSSEIKKFDRQIAPARKALNTLERASGLLLFPTGKAELNKLRKAVNALDRNRRNLVSQRNALHARLDRLLKSQAAVGATYEKLFDLQAEVKTSLWVSESYATWYLSLVYKLFCFAILLVLLWKFSLSSWVFIVTVLTAFVASIYFVEAPVSFNLWVVCKFVIFSIIVKSLYLAFAENYPTVRAQSRSFLVRTLGHSLKYYSPFVVLIVAGLVASIQVNHYIDEKLYGLEFVENSDPSSNTRRYDIDVAVNDFFEAKEISAHARLEKLRTKSVQGVADEVVRIFADIFAPELPDMNPAFNLPRCDAIYHWITRTGRCVEKEVKQPLNGTYSEVRDEELENLKESSNAYADQADGKIQNAIAIAKRDLSDRIMALRSAIKNQLRILYFFIDLYAWISLLILIVIILKSFIYIFARIFYASDTFDSTRAIQFVPEANPLHNGSIREISNTLRLTDDMGEVIHANKAYDFANAPPDETTPQANRAFFSRFRNGVWHLNRIKTGPDRPDKEVPYRRIPDNERIIVWTMKPGDEVVFSWRNFVGMSESIGIRTRYSWHLSSLIFGRMFFAVASVDPGSTRDGTLILVARGSDGIDKSTNPSNSPDQLLAWQTTTRFQLLANLSFRNIYRSGFQLRARESDLAVMHLSDNPRRNGAAMFLKFFIVPS